MGRRYNEKIVMEELSISIDAFLRMLIANLGTKLTDTCSNNHDWFLNVSTEV